MLRSMFLCSERLYRYTCLVIPPVSHKLDLSLHYGVASTGTWNVCNHVHTTPVITVLSKDHPQKKLAAKEGQSVEKAPVDDEDNVNMEELRAGSLFPTAGTHSLVIDGVTYQELPIIHIKSTHNNTILSITKHTGEALAMTTAGMEGFKNAKKGTNIAAQAAGISAGQKALAKGLSTVRVAVRGIGPGRLPSIKGLQMAGLNIVSITDVTRIQHSWQRPRKQRRL